VQTNLIKSYISVNTFHLNTLVPLIKWKILRLQLLKELANYHGKINTFRKILIRLENNGIVKSFIEPMNKSKYVYLTKTGASLVGQTSFKELSNEILYHDSKVVEITRELLKLKSINKVELEHEICSLDTLIPDAILSGSKNNINFNLAFELEITQKSKQRIIEKVRDYLNAVEFDYVLYVFCSEAILKNYTKTINEKIGEKVWQKIIFLYVPSILNGETKLENTKCYFNNQEVEIKNVL